jgi:hypothetical protein
LTRKPAVRFLFAIVFTASALVAAPAVAFAGDGTGQVQCDPANPQPGCTVEVGTPGTMGGSSGGHTAAGGVCHDPTGAVIPCHTRDGDVGPDGCYYRLATAADGIDPTAPGPNGGPGAWYVQTCTEANLSSQSVVFLQTAPVVTPQVLAAQARSMLRLPPVVVMLNPAGEQLVGLPTWLSVAAGSWTPQSATATVPGVSVTATAMPVRAVWQMGDGSTVTCAGPGTPWRPGLDPAAASPDCGYRYPRSSADEPGAAFTVTVTITWIVSWAGAGAAGTVAGLTTVAALPVRVAESQGVLQVK